MRSFGIALVVILIAMAAFVGLGVFQAVLAQVLVTTGQVAPAAGPPYYYGHPYGWGLGFGFGLLFPIFFIFLLVALVSAVRGGRRWGSGGPWSDRRTMFEEWHRQAHTEGPQRASDPNARRDT